MDPARQDAVPVGAWTQRRTQMRRGIDATTVWQLGVLAVVWASGALLIFVIAAAVEPSTALDPLGVVIVWTLTGGFLFVPAIERLLARVLLGLRRPTPEQLAIFRVAWARVCAQAGVRADRYVLRVQPTGALNATAGAGHLVGVTSTALGLPARHLEAVLAHELGHHLGGHAMIGMLHAWYSWPLRLLVRTSMWVGRLASIAVAIVRPLSGILALILLPLVAVSCAGSLLVPLIVAPITVTTIVMRRSELRADATAARLGYGAELLSLYRGWAAHEPPPPGPLRSLRAFLRDTHPRFDVRVRHLERALGIGQ